MPLELAAGGRSCNGETLASVMQEHPIDPMQGIAAHVGALSRRGLSLVL
jgi:hypothetical protein